MSSRKSSRWNGKGPIAQALRDAFNNERYIERGVTAGDVWKSNPMYQEYKLDNFRTNFNKMKKSILRSRREEAEGLEDDVETRTNRVLHDLQTHLDGKNVVHIFYLLFLFTYIFHFSIIRVRS